MPTNAFDANLRSGFADQHLCEGRGTRDPELDDRLPSVGEAARRYSPHMHNNNTNVDSGCRSHQTLSLAIPAGKEGRKRSRGEDTVSGRMFEWSDAIADFTQEPLPPSEKVEFLNEARRPS